MILKIIGWLIINFLVYTLIGVVKDGILGYKIKSENGTFDAGSRGEHVLTKKTFISKFISAIVIQLAVIGVLIYWLTLG